MATKESVTEAERECYGPIAEGQSLVEIYKRCDDAESIACIAIGVIERFCDCFEAFHSELVRHGYTATLPDESQPVPADVPDASSEPA